MIEISWLTVVDILEHAAQLSNGLRGPAALDPAERARLTAEQTGLIKGVAMIVAGRYQSPLYERTFYHVRDMLDEGRDIADVALSLFAGLEDKIQLSSGGVRNGTPTYIECNGCGRNDDRHQQDCPDEPCDKCNGTASNHAANCGHFEIEKEN